MARVAPIKDVSDPRWVRAVSHPLRMRLISLLEQRTASPKMLADQLDVSLGVVAYHVRTLCTLGAVELVETRQRRGALEHYYRANAHPRYSDEAWAQLDVVSKQRVLNGVLSEAHADATSAAAAGGFDASDAHFTRTPLQLDAEGWTKLAAASKRWLEEAAEIQRESSARIEDDQHPDLQVELVILLFEALGQRREQYNDEHHAPAAKKKIAGPSRVSERSVPVSPATEL